MARMYCETTEKVRPIRVIRVQKAATSDFEKTMSLGVRRVGDCYFVLRFQFGKKVLCL